MASESLYFPRISVILFPLTVLSIALAGYTFSGEKYIQSALLIISGLVLSFRIIKSYNDITRATLDFFESVSNDDTSFRFPEKARNQVQLKLYTKLNELKDHYQGIKVKNELNETFYKSIIQQSSAGLVVLSEEGTIELINKAACRFAGISPYQTSSNTLKSSYPEFFNAVYDINPGETRTFRNIINNTLHILSFRATSVKRDEKLLKLISIHDIRNELEARELESYRKLMNVMTHEIMNLLTPLTTVAKELSSAFDNLRTGKGKANLDEKMISSTRHGLGLIGEHGDTLMNFINNYRKISRLPEPKYEKIDIADWIAQLKIAFMGRMESERIQFSVRADNTLKTITADKRLLNQCIINIINNAIEAVSCVSNERNIDLVLKNSLTGKVTMTICNNGPVIPASISDKIFVPFFTTKSEGSGIGLSIAQEIIKLHHGSLTVISSEDRKTCFVIELLNSTHEKIIDY